MVYQILVRDENGETGLDILADYVQIRQDVVHGLPSTGEIPYPNELDNHLGGTFLGLIHLDIVPVKKEDGTLA